MSPWKKLMAFRSLDETNRQNIVDWAYAELLVGHDTPNLRILAGLRPPLDSWEVDHYFSAALDELGWQLEDGKQFLHAYALEIARDIVSGVRSAASASRDIYTICCALDYPVELSNWLDIADEWECEVYGLSHSEVEATIKREAQRMLEEDSTH